MPQPINAKSEEIATKPMFRSAYRSRRCLVPIDGFFEWQDIHSTGKNKKPYAIALKSGKPFASAGLWETWRDPENDINIRTFTIAKTDANEMMSKIHDRMPVLLDPSDYDRWLSDEPDPRDLLKQYPSELMKMWPIGRDVGNVKNDRPDIIEEIDDDPPPSDPQPTLF